jgi:ABC-type branched-subunit amino acid transport system ATPase component
MVVAFQFVAGVGLGVAGPALNGALSVVIPPKLRSLGFALVGLFILLGGGFAGSIIFGAISDATSERFALTLLAPIGVLGALILSGAALHIRRDVAIVAEEILEEEAERSRLAGGGAPHLLSAHNLDFAYGRTQVLFDVNVDVDEGEVLALLGTNGAGKSTLLRAISGLQHPIRGTIRFDGENITYLEAEDIVRRGILQIPGGRMTFPTLTVTENLRTGAFAWRKDAAVTGRIDQVFEFFPQLDERRSTRAGALSGGEQQMLSLARAMLVRPRLLLVDELSLGLAPVVVEGLIGVLEQMHADGTTLLLVEQSVNVALTIADRAVFLEKGEIRFEGSASSLLRRPDLLRSVFLEGATRR